MLVLTDQYPEKEQIKGELPTTAGILYTCPAGAGPQKLEVLSVNNTGGSTQTVDLAVVAADETYAANTYDVISGKSLATNVAATIDILPIFLNPGDRLYGLASAAGVNYIGYVGKERTTNRNFGGN